MQLLTRTAVAEHLNQLRPSSLTFIDVETNGRTLSDPSAGLAGLSLYQQGTPPISIPLRMVGPVAEPGTMEPLLSFLATARLGSFHVGMEAAWLAAVYKLFRLTWVSDPWVAARMHGHEGGLKALVEQLLGKRMLRLREDLGTTNFMLLESTHPLVSLYMEEDVQYAAELADALPLTGTDALRYQDEVRINATMAEAWLDGTPVRIDLAMAHMQELSAQEASAEASITKVLGALDFPLGSPRIGERLERIGLRSPLQTPTGRPSWSAEALDTLRDAHPVVGFISMWRSVHRQRSMLSSLLECSSLASIYPLWFTTSAKGRPSMTSSGPSLTQLPVKFREFFPAELRRRWVGLDRSPETNIWWLFGWADPDQVRDGLACWAETAANLGMSTEVLTQICRQWLLYRGTDDPMGGFVTSVPARDVEAAVLAFEHVWGALVDGIDTGLKSGAVKVHSVHGAYVRHADSVPTADIPATRRALMRILANDASWSATKKQILLLWDYKRASRFIPNVATLAMHTAESVESISESLASYRYTHRPQTPQYAQSGATWAEATDYGQGG